MTSSLFAFRLSFVKILRSPAFFLDFEHNIVKTEYIFELMYNLQAPYKRSVIDKQPGYDVHDSTSITPTSHFIQYFVSQKMHCIKS